MAQDTKQASIFKKRSFLFGVAAVLIVAAAGGVVAYLGAPTSASSGSRQAPEFELKDSQGKTHRLTEFRGTPVVLHFWASWCPPCLSEIPEWVELAGRFQRKLGDPGSKVKFVAVSVDQNWADALKVLPARSLPANVLSLLDDSGKVPDRFGTFQFPETYLIDAKGQVVMKWVGGQNWSAPEVQRLIEKEAKEAR